MASSKFDQLGITASALCLLHCALTPVLFASLVIAEPLVGEHRHEGGPIIWALLDPLFLLIGFWAVWHASRGAASWGVRGGLWFGWCLFAVGLLGHWSHLHTEWLMYGGSAVLILVHGINFRMGRSCPR